MKCIVSSAPYGKYGLNFAQISDVHIFPLLKPRVSQDTVEPLALSPIAET